MSPVSNKVERIGIFGGTFDPIHIAHLAVGVAALHQLQLDRVLFVVSNGCSVVVNARTVAAKLVGTEPSPETSTTTHASVTAPAGNVTVGGTR